MQMFDAINEPLREAFSLNATQLSLLSSAYLWGDLLFLLPAGVLLDRFSTRKIIIYAMWLSVISTLGFAFASTFWVAAFWHFLTGIGNAFCFLACVILAARWFPPNRQAMVIGLVVTIAFLGGMLAQAPFEKLAQMVGWRKAMLYNGALGLVLLTFIAKTVADAPSKHAINYDHPRASVLNELKQVLRNGQNSLAGLYTCLLNLPIMVLCALWGNEALKTVHGMTSAQATTIVTMIFVGSIVGSPVAGWISDNWGYRKRPMIIGAALSLMVMLYFIMSPSLSFTSLLFLFFLLGLFTSAQVIGYPLVAESNCHRLTATATGWASLIIMGGAAVAQLLFGQLLDWHWQGTMAGGQRLYSAVDYHFAMLLFPIAFLAALIAMLFTQETFCKRMD